MKDLKRHLNPNSKTLTLFLLIAIMVMSSTIISADPVTYPVTYEMTYEITYEAPTQEEYDLSPLNHFPITVTFNANGGNGGQVRSALSITPVGALPPNPTRAGHAFVGWYTTSAQTGGVRVTSNFILPDHNVVFWARWADPFFAVYGSMGFRFPLDNPASRHISGGFRTAGRPNHAGIDIQRNLSHRPDGYNPVVDEVVHAAHGGQVLWAADNGSAGYSVIIRSNVIDPRTGNRIVSRYAHMRPTLYVSRHQQVAMGVPIGRVWNSGDTSGSGPGGRSSGHLHLDFSSHRTLYRASGDFLNYLINAQRFFPHINFTGTTFGPLH